MQTLVGIVRVRDKSLMLADNKIENKYMCHNILGLETLYNAS